MRKVIEGTCKTLSFVLLPSEEGRVEDIKSEFLEIPLK